MSESGPVEDASTVQTSRYHPQFDKKVTAFTDRTLTLVASDGMHFRVSAIILMKASPVFESMFSLPAQLASEEEEVVIDKDIVAASSKTVEILLKMVTGQEIPIFDVGIENMLPVIWAAEKWDMHGPLSIFRLLLRNKELITHDPIETYKIGIFFNWNEIAEAATEHISHGDLYNSKHASNWEEVPIKEFLHLMRHHKSRQDQLESVFRKSIVPLFKHSCSYEYDMHFISKLETLNSRILATAFNTSPGHIFEEQEAKALLEAASLIKCYNCSHLYVDAFAFLKNLNSAWASLRKYSKSTDLKKEKTTH